MVWRSISLGTPIMTTYIYLDIAVPIGLGFAKLTIAIISKRKRLRLKMINEKERCKKSQKANNYWNKIVSHSHSTVCVGRRHRPKIIDVSLFTDRSISAWMNVVFFVR